MGVGRGCSRGLLEVHRQAVTIRQAVTVRRRGPWRVVRAARPPSLPMLVVWRGEFPSPPLASVHLWLTRTSYVPSSGSASSTWGQRVCRGEPGLVRVISGECGRRTTHGLERMPGRREHAPSGPAACPAGRQPACPPARRRSFHPPACRRRCMPSCAPAGLPSSTQPSPPAHLRHRLGRLSLCQHALRWAGARDGRHNVQLGLGPAASKAGASQGRVLLVAAGAKASSQQPQ